MNCHKNIYNEIGTCVASSTPNPVPSPIGSTSAPTVCPCLDPSNIPDKCEVDILIDMMEAFVLANHALISQWLRAAFHDAGTFDQTAGVGGANGCLLTDPDMR